MPNPIALYYWLTPVFWALDLLFGANLRAAAFEGHPAWTGFYYLFCLSCGVALWIRPSWTRIVGLTESSANILVLVLGFFVPYFRLIDRLAAGEAEIDDSPFSIQKSLSLLLSGLVCYAAFRMNERKGQRI